MALIFVDTDCWIAFISPNDGLRTKAVAVANELKLSGNKLVTSEMVLTEVLTSFKGQYAREVAARAVAAITNDASVEVEPQTRALFQNAFAVYRKYADKNWSMTDCASFDIMKRRGITTALTHDHHFEQNGFVALLRSGA